jgi:primosomal protein N' (replication factor Y)
MTTARTSSLAEDEFDAAAPAERVRVLLPLPLTGAYDYRAALSLHLRPGDFVHVPLGKRSTIGVVWDALPSGADSDVVPENRLKDVIEKLDAPALPPATRKFVDWVSAYTLAPQGAVLRMAMSVAEALEPPRPLLGLVRAGSAPDPNLNDPGERRLTPSRRRVLHQAAQPLSSGELARRAAVGSSVVKAMVALGWLDTVELPRVAPPSPDGNVPGPELSADQRDAADAMVESLGKGFSVTLLDGVTGSGKTEVYFEAVAASLRAGKQVLVLLPEIAMSAQWLARFTQRFGAPPAAWHSELPSHRRRATWRDIAEGRARVVVGARSALFLPYADLGLIVVDEEHEAAFKQEDGVIYHARDMAVVRARTGQIPIVLVSATPSLETVVNVEQGRYSVLHLPDRHGGALLPAIRTIDLRRDPPPRRAWLSPVLRDAVTQTLASGEQAMLFLNRRGYAPLTLCRGCGHRLQCPSCTAWLVEHRLAGRLQCHHCGYSAPLPHKCPACEAEGSFAACGPGVERVAEEAHALFPDARIEIMTSDTIAGPDSASAFVERMAKREIDLLVGTQIVAKGHHFPWLTLVGVVDADLGLSGGDLRAAERTYQLLHQVAGRAGRAERPGQVLLQTYMPEHPVLRALVQGARDRFLAAEIDERRRLSLPPFGRLAALIIAGPDEREVDTIARQLAKCAPRREGLSVLGPAPAPLAILRGRHRRRFLIKARRDDNLQSTLADWVGSLRIPAAVRVQIDIDPYSFL